MRVPRWGLSGFPAAVLIPLCLPELEEFAHFDFGVWRKRYMQWISQMKSRVLDVFRGIDRDQDGRISQREFIESVLSSSECAQDPWWAGAGSRGCAPRDGAVWERRGQELTAGHPPGRRTPAQCQRWLGLVPGCAGHSRAEGPRPSPEFPTNVLEMNAVASIFDMNGDGFIDYYEFVSTLHPNRDPLRRTADADQIQDEVRPGGRGGTRLVPGHGPDPRGLLFQVNRQVAQCNCAKRFQVEQISANRYRVGATPPCCPSLLSPPGRGSWACSDTHTQPAPC